MLVVSEELDELFEICDRLVVIAQGRVSPSVATAEATIEQIGEWMSGLWNRDAAGEPCSSLKRGPSRRGRCRSPRRCSRWRSRSSSAPVLFVLLGKDPLRGLAVFFVEPVKSVYALTELAVKATPLLLIALGLAVCFRSNVWNIGAEGQFIVGAIAASGVAMLAGQGHRQLDLPAGARRRRARRHAVGGDRRPAARPLQRQRDPGQPDARLRRRAAAQLPRLRAVEGPARLQLPADDHLPEVDAGAAPVRQLPRQHRRDRRAASPSRAFWILLFRTYAGFQLQVGGLAPAAARYAGFSSRKALWTALLLSGAHGRAGRWRSRSPGRSAS